MEGFAHVDIPEKSIQALDTFGLSKELETVDLMDLCHSDVYRSRKNILRLIDIYICQR